MKIQLQQLLLHLAQKVSRKELIRLGDTAAQTYISFLMTFIKKFSKEQPDFKIGGLFVLSTVIDWGMDAFYGIEILAWHGSGMELTAWQGSGMGNTAWDSPGMGNTA